MANLSNINNKLIVTDGGHLLINQTANNNYRLQMDGADGTVYAWFKSNVATTGARIGLNGDDLRVFNQQAAGELHLGTAGSTKMTIDSSGNVGIGITPNINSTVVDVLQLGKGMTIMGNANDDRATMGANLYLDAATAFRYVMDGYAGRFSIEDGGMLWGLSAIGTEGNVATVNTKMTLLNNGNLGIGITTPQTTLQVNGAASAFNAHFGQGTNNSSGVWGGISLGYSEAANASYRKVGIVAKAIGDGAARQELHFLVDVNADGGSASIADSKMMINTSGKVGIGTTTIPNPFSSAYSNILQVGTTSGNTRLVITSGTTKSSDLAFADSNTATDAGSYAGSVSYKHSGDYMLFATAATEKMRITSGGNVGIGSQSPDILSYGNTSIALAVQGIIGTASAQRPVVVNLAGQRDDGTDGYVSDINFLNMASNGTTVNSRAIMRMSRETADNSNRLEFWTANAGTTTERLRIKSDGNILVADTRQIQFNNTDQFIGATSVNDLEIKAGDDINYRSNFSRFFSGTTEHARLTGVGATSWVSNGSSTHNFGVGTSGPTSKLTVYGGGSTSSTLELRGGANGGDNATISTQQSMRFQIGSAGATGRSYSFAKGGLGYGDGTTLAGIDSVGTFTAYPAAGSYGVRQNGVSSICNSGYVAGTGTLSFTYDASSQGSMFIECVMNHYGFITSYGCARIATVAIGPNIQINDIQNITSGNGGSWTFSRVSNTQFTIAKTAGTYAGGGYYFVNIRGNGVKYT